jgi:imidazolonepropionase-like amidohydrolase
MRKVIRRNIEVIGVDNIKLSMSGDAITETRSAEDCYFTDEETRACVDEAHKLKKRLCAHARARDSVIMCAQHDIDVVYHASFVDDEGKYQRLVWDSDSVLARLFVLGYGRASNTALR